MPTNRLGICTLVAVLLAGSVEGARPVAAQTLASPAPLPTCTLSAEFADLGDMSDLDAEAKEIKPADLGKTINGIYKSGVDYAPEVQPQLNIGRQSDGKYHVSFTYPTCLNQSQQKAYERDMFGAFLAASADSGKAGEVMKSAYDAAPDKRRISRILSRAFQMYNENEAAASDASIAILRSLPIGEKRSAVYKALESHSIVVYNFLYSPGVSFDHGLGCDPQKTKKLAEYPFFREPLPRYRCASLRGQKVELSPSASSQFGYGFNLACGSRKDADLDFDDNDRLKRVTISELRQVCL